MDQFYRYLLFQTFPEILSLSNVDEYSQILDESSLLQFQSDLQDMQLLLVSVETLVRIPRAPSGPSWIEKQQG